MEKSQVKVVDRLFDIKGVVTKQPVTIAKVFCFIIGILLPVICSSLPLQAYGEKAGIALGLVLSLIVWMIGGVLSPGACWACFGFAVVGLKVIPLASLQGGVGAGLFLTMVGLCVVAVGIETTPFGNRLALFMLKMFGKKPASILYVMTATSIILSALLSNVAVIILMSMIAIKVFEHMNLEKGKSKFAAAVMLAIVAGAQIGGAGLPQGSPGYNLLMMSLFEKTTGTPLTYVQWSVVALPIVLLMIFPTGWIYTKLMKVNSENIATPDKAYFTEELAKLGKITGSEVRWIATVVAMIVCLMAGMTSNFILLLFVAISVAPVIGTCSPRDGFSKVPWEIVFAMALAPTVSMVMGATGLAGFFSAVFSPMMAGLSPFMFMMLLVVIMVIINQVAPGAQMGFATILVTIFGSVAMGMGYNPLVMLMPSMMLISNPIALHSHPVVLCSYGFGWWNSKDGILPGFVLNLFGAVVYGILIYFLGPVLWGTSILL